MSLTLVVWILTALAAVVVVLTRLRLSGQGEGGRPAVSATLTWAHFVVGSLACVVWVAFLLAPQDSWLGGSFVGICALGGWWVTSWLGILILMRWRRSRGRHAPAIAGDSWSKGPGLSILAHVGMALGVCVFTYAYLTSAV